MAPIRKVQEWWSVKEKLPDADILVEVCTADGALYSGFTVEDDGTWVNDGGFTAQEEIAYWADYTSPLNGEDAK
jgi:hypothetical protein